jgi:hypothetical protein
LAGLGAERGFLRGVIEIHGDSSSCHSEACVQRTYPKISIETSGFRVCASKSAVADLDNDVAELG